jgi:hypothetical protein
MGPKDEGGFMKVRLAPSWELTDERAETSHGQPVLVNLWTQEVFRPEDILEPYPYWGLKPAAVHVGRMIQMKEFSDDELEFARRFKLPLH